MKDTGAVDKCSDGGQIKDLLNLLKDYPKDKLSLTTTWMKDSGAWGKCSDGDEIRVILAVLKNMDLVLIQDTSKPLPIDRNYADFYVMMHKFFPQDKRFKKALYSLLEDQSNRKRIIESIQRIFGKESPITQEFIYLVIGLENNSATSVFAVHKEMLEKRA